MERIRGFEVVSSFEGQAIELPKRASTHAAGYDLQAAETIELPSIWETLKAGGTPQAVLVATGVKAYMAPDEYLELVNRSSGSLKRNLIVANGVGVIDSDYYNNPGNEGHIYFQFYNFNPSAFVIEKGERIGQGIFKRFLLADSDETLGKRIGGFGSSGK
ncbi:dUTP diphosphatase [Enterococcus hirae]|nr:dUTP diphosphatase [Enterococcus hirae]